MDLVFSPRLGDERNWRRELVVRIGKLEYGPYTLMMWTTSGARRGEARDRSGRVVWSGACSTVPTPLRAFAVAAGLCTESGVSDIEPPDWLK